MAEAGPDALSVREQKGVGMNEPLVDAEGYPRADVDVYQVRAARHNIICLQNDHKALMLQVEKALHQLHAREKEKQAKDEAEAQAEAMIQNQSLPQPFARVNAVTPGSPASISASSIILLPMVQTLPVGPQIWQVALRTDLQSGAGFELLFLNHVRTPSWWVGHGRGNQKCFFFPSSPVDTLYDLG
ncbi:26S proteasome non-ATPase regulatory subunit 9 isoform 2-T2 [Pangshura tecta]